MNLKASTLAEMMVVMIISGIIIGLLFDGVNIFRKYSNVITTHFLASNKLLTTSNHLTSLIENSDSLKQEQEQEIIIYRKGAIFSEIRLSDSLLIICNDTLSLKVTEIEVKTSLRADTLKVKTNDKTLYFTTRERPEVEVIKQIEQKEYETTK